MAELPHPMSHLIAPSLLSADFSDLKSAVRMVDESPTPCLQQGLITKSVKLPAANAVGMVPNPADDDATLVLSAPLEDGGQLLMTNAMGAVVLSVRIPADQLRTAVHTTTLATGIYHYSVRTASGVFGKGTLNVAHTH